MDTQRFSQHLRLLRGQLGWSQEAVAEKLGVTGQAVSKWEQGISCPDISLLPALAELYGVTVDALLGGNASPGLGDAALLLRRIMSELPQQELYDAAYQLAFVLHEGLCTGGYRERVPWQARADAAWKRVTHWGYSARSEPEGMTVMHGGAVAFTSARRRSSLQPGPIRAICQRIGPLGQPEVLKTLFALTELSRQGVGYASAEQIARQSGLREEAVVAALDQLPVEETRRSGQNPAYRLAGPAQGGWAELLGLFGPW